MAKAREIPGLDAEGSYGQAAARIVSVRAREVVDHASDVLDLGDIERVHDMRVATRRLRAALEIFEPCFPAKRFRRALDEVKELADALGERRDRDVAIDALSHFSSEMAAPDRPGIDGLVRELRQEQLEANVELAPYVSREHLAALHERLAELIAMARGIERGLLEPAAEAPEEVEEEDDEDSDDIEEDADEDIDEVQELEALIDEGDRPEDSSAGGAGNGVTFADGGLA